MLGVGTARGGRHDRRRQHGHRVLRLPLLRHSIPRNRRRLRLTYGPYDNFRVDDGELSSGYIGFTFDTDLGDAVYARAKVTLQPDGILTVERWAYDDEGGSIAAGAIPAPGALGLLALAGAAAGIRRKRQD